MNEEGMEKASMRAEDAEQNIIQREEPVDVPRAAEYVVTDKGVMSRGDAASWDAK